MSFCGKMAITTFKLIQYAKVGGVLENSGYLLQNGHWDFQNFSFVCLFYGWFALKTGSSKYPNEKNFKWKNMANVIFWHMWDPPKILATFFQIFGLFLGIYPPCLWLYLKSFHAKHFKIIKYQCTIVTLTRWDWFWV